MVKGETVLLTRLSRHDRHACKHAPENLLDVHVTYADVRKLSIIFNSIVVVHLYAVLQGGPKNGTIFRTPYNFAKY